MRYLYIGFMLAVGAFIGLAVCLWTVKNREALSKWLVRVVQAAGLSALAIYVWLDAGTIFNPNTREGRIALGVAVVVVIGLLSWLWEAFISPTLCICGHAQRRHRDSCKELACACPSFEKQCHSCEHAEHGIHQCVAEGCLCGYRESEPFSVIAKRGFRNFAATIAIVLLITSLWVGSYSLWLRNLTGDTQDTAVILMVCGTAILALLVHLLLRQKKRRFTA